MDRLAIKSEKTRMELAIDKMYRDLKKPPRDLSDYSNFDDDYLDDLESLSDDDCDDCDCDWDDSEEEDMVMYNEWDDVAEFIGGSPTDTKSVKFNDTIPNINENKYQLKFCSGYASTMEFLNSNGPFEFLQIIESINDIKIIYKLKKVEEK